MNRALSTLGFDHTSDPLEIFSKWHNCALTNIVLALDARFSLSYAETLVQHAIKSEIRCVEISMPQLTQTYKKEAALGSPLKDEFQAAINLALEVIECAARHHIPRVNIMPQLLTLHQSIGELEKLHSENEAYSFNELLKERASYSEAAFDRWCHVLDPLLNSCLNHQITLQMISPTVWPHQYPNLDEIFMLKKEFSGANFSYQEARDWSSLRDHLWPVEDEPTKEDEVPPEIAAMLSDDAIENLLKPQIEKEHIPQPSSYRIARSDIKELNIALPIEEDLEHYLSDIDDQNTPLVLVSTSKKIISEFSEL